MEGLQRFDVEAFRAINIGLHNSVLDVLMWAFSYSGLGIMQVVLSLLFLIWPKTRHFTIPLIVTVAFSGLAVAQVLKQLIPRDRPSNLVWARPMEDFHYGSFPSGHTTTAFATACMLLLLTYGTPQRKIGFFALCWAPLVGFSRIYRGVHWPTDVLAGVFCGAFAACLVYLILDLLGVKLSYSGSNSGADSS